MSKKLLLRNDFDIKLKKLKIKTKYLNYFNKFWKVKKSTKITIINIQDSWFDLISISFLWKNTPEGYDYWEEIAKK